MLFNTSVKLAHNLQATHMAHNPLMCVCYLVTELYHIAIQVLLRDLQQWAAS